MNTNSIKECQNILNSISDGFLILDKDWSVNWCNNAFEIMTGASHIDTVNTNVWALFDRVDGLNVRLQFEKAFEEQVPRQFEKYIPQNNQWLLINIYPSADSLVVYFQDITRVREFQENILIDERNLRILINITPQPVWLIDRNCNMLISNEPFKKWITYFTGRELNVGDSVLSEDLGVNYLNKFRMCYELAMSGKTFNTVEDMIIDGELKFTTISFNPVFDNNNVLTGICCHATDITDQRKNLSQLDAQTQLLMEIANIQSHKVRGPVSTLLGLIHIFNFDDPAHPDNLEVMQGVASVAKKLDMVVKDVIRSINLLSKHNKANR